MDKDKAVALAMGIPGRIMAGECGFLWDLVHLCPPGKVIVELGCYMGRSTAMLCHAAGPRKLPVYSIDNFSYRDPCSLGQTRENLERLGLKPNLIDADSRLGPSVTSRQLRGAVGLLFVDTDHVKTQFDAEMKAWLPVMHPQGIVAAHDYASPTWLEMKGAIDGWFAKPEWVRVGLVRRLIAFMPRAK
jgi:predicted O-methyltransferase YrrM